MKIRFWGCRGSLPTPGPTTLRYGGNTTCVEVRLRDGRLVLIDAGSGMRLLGKALLAEGGHRVIGMLVTHSHWDHLMGFPFFSPAYHSRYRIHVWGGSSARQSVRHYLERQMEPPFFPVDFGVMKAEFVFGEESPTEVPEGFSEIMSVPLSHPNGGSGFRFIEGGRSFVFLTDNELGFRHDGGLTRDEYVNFCCGADLLVHDAQYTEAEYARTRGWGHSTYKDAVDLAVTAGVKRLGLTHHDPDRTDDELGVHLAWCRERIAATGVAVECFVCAEGLALDV